MTLGFSSEAAETLDNRKAAAIAYAGGTFPLLAEPPLGAYRYQMTKPGKASPDGGT
jgi:hypothetical protein